MSLKYIFLLSALILACVSKGQSKADTSRPQIFSFVEQMPSPEYDYIDYISRNIHYPQAAIDSNIQGKVIVRIVVNEDGSITDCKVMRGVERSLDEEALRVIKSFPKWKPGMQNGKAVKVYFTIPVTYNLEVAANKTDTVAMPEDKKPTTEYNLVEFIGNNIQYPRTAWNHDKQGMVLTRFVVNEDGHISDWEIVNGVCPELDAEAIRIVKSMPNWKPGIHNGKVARISVTLPITFTIKKRNQIQTAIPRDNPRKRDNNDHRLPVGRAK